MEDAFAARGWRVKRDSPFAGTFVPGGFYQTDERVHSVMIEVRRGLYMDEASGKRLRDFGAVGAAIVAAVATALDSTQRS